MVFIKGEKRMQVKAVINEKYEEMEIHVCNNEADANVMKMVGEISSFVNPGLLVQRKNGDKAFISEKDVISFYAEDQKVFARTSDDIYVISKKLYELESELNERLFFRISKSEIINLKRIQRLDMSLSGTIKVIMKDGSETFTSRRNVKKLKQVLGA